jgi:uncharacterized membrane protein YedE/YeeE
VRTRVAGAAIGVVFGLTLCWSGMSNPSVIRDALLFRSAYLFLMFGSAVLVAVVGLRLLRRLQPRALFTGARVAWAVERPERRHVVGSLLFGLGWGIADACPGPITAQLGEGSVWALFTMAGVLAGVNLFLARASRDTEPATEPPAPGRLELRPSRASP